MKRKKREETTSHFLSPKESGNLCLLTPTLWGVETPGLAPLVGAGRGQERGHQPDPPGLPFWLSFYQLQGLRRESSLPELPLPPD